DGNDHRSGDHDSEDALYDIHRHVLAEILTVAHSPSVVETTVEVAAERAIGQRCDSAAERAVMLNDDPIPASEESRRQWIRSRLVRTLLDDPVLYFQDLNDEERNYLDKYRGSLLRELCDATGLIAEVRREGIALVDDAGDLTDLKLPDQGAESHLSLLLVRWFADCFKTRRGKAISTTEVEERVRELIHTHRSEWHKDIREAGTEMRMAEDALSRIRALHLVQVSPDGIVPLPAACRYSASEWI
ncbi:MAG TPA: TIGR02678 family protein, partial [Terriglobia bacterium]|nr:TIGR02678 family protein [Terriglobia bacterium]